MNIGSFLLVNFLNALMGLGFMVLGALAVVLVLHILTKLTPWRMQNVFEEGVSGGSIIAAALLLGMCVLLAATGF